MMKLFKSILLIALLAVVQSVCADSTFSGGSGTKEDPYRISSVADLNQLANDVNGGNTYELTYFKLTNDISYDPKQLTIDNDGDGNNDSNFTPIGTASSFNGVFDGLGYTISGIVIANSSRAALFGQISYWGKVIGVTLADAIIEGSLFVGGIVGDNGGTVIGCKVLNSVELKSKANCYQPSVGGIAGRNGASIQVCVSSAILTHGEGVTGTPSYGGITGLNDGSLYHNLALGVVLPDLTKNVGAICGSLSSNNPICNNNFYLNCKLGETVKSSDFGVNGSDITEDGGAMCAYTISGNNPVNVSFGDEKKGTGPNIAGYESGIIYDGQLYTSSGRTVTLALDYGNIEEGYIAEYQYEDVKLTADGDCWLLDMPAKDISISGSLVNVWGVSVDNDGSTADKAFTITTTSGLNLLAKRVNGGKDYADKYFKIGSDIEYTTNGTKTNYTPIGYDSDGNRFLGHFDGKGYTISGICINNEGLEQSLLGYALFGAIGDGATVENIVLSEASVIGEAGCAGIVGYNIGGTIQNCHVDSEVVIQASVGESYGHGGIVGYNQGVVEGCTSAATLSVPDGLKGCKDFGGIAGLNDEGGTIENCLALCVHISANAVGGAIVGENSGTLLKNFYYNCSVGELTSNIGVGIETNYETLDAHDTSGAMVSLEPTSKEPEGIGDKLLLREYGVTVYENGLKYKEIYYTGGTENPGDGTVTVGDFKYLLATNGNNAQIVGPTNQSVTAVDIPQTINYDNSEYTVISIAERAFENCTSLTTVTIPSSMSNIGKYAFAGCSSLATVTCNAESVSADESAFDDIAKDATLYVPDTNNYTGKPWSKFSSIEAIGGEEPAVVDFIDGIYYNLDAKTETAEVTKGKTAGGDDILYTGEVTIPASIKKDDVTYHVTSIADYAFQSCSQLTSVTIPEGVTSIGDHAFSTCGITSLTLPSTVTKIGERAFWECDGIKQVTIPGGITEIGAGVFSGCRNLASLSINGNNTKYYTSEDGHALMEVDGKYVTLLWSNSIIPTEVKIVGCNAFTYSNISSIVIPEGVESILTDAFDSSENLTSITIPSTVTEIAYGAFRNCPKLETVICNATNVPTTHKYAFQDSNNANVTLTVPQGSESAYNVVPWNTLGGGEEPGEDPTTLVAVSIGGISYLLDADNNTATMTAGDEPYTGSISIPATVTYENENYSVIIGAGAFTNAITDVTIESETMLTAVDNAFDGLTVSGITLHVPNNLLTSYQGSAVWGGFDIVSIDNNNPENPQPTSAALHYEITDTEEKTVKVVAVQDMNTEKYRGEIIIPSSVKIENVDYTVTQIDQQAFAGSEVTSVSIPATVSIIGASAFQSCSDLETIEVEANNPNFYIESKALIESGTKTLLKGFVDTTIPDDIKVIGENAFSSLGNLTSITIPASVESIEYMAFMGTGLTQLTIPGNVKTIGAEAFRWCKGLSSVTLSEGIETLQGMCFADGSEQLTSIAIPASVISIAEDAFANSPDLAEITVDANNANYYSTDNKKFLIEIDKESKKLIWGRLSDDVEFPKDVTVIGGASLSSNTGISTLVIPEGVTTINPYACERCTNLVSVTLPSTLKGMGHEVFSDCNKLTSVTCLATNVPKADQYTFPEDNKITLTVPVGTKKKYKADEAWAKLSKITDGSVVVDSNGTQNESGNISCAVDNTSATPTATITDVGNTQNGEVTIPSIVSVGGNDVLVVSIADDAFAGNTEITSVSIPESIITIGDGAFSDCKSLASVEIPASVTSIGEGAFAGCDNVNYVDLSKADNLTVYADDIKRDGNGALAGLNEDAVVVLPANMGSESAKTISDVVPNVIYSEPSSGENNKTYKSEKVNLSDGVAFAVPPTITEVTVTSVTYNRELESEYVYTACLSYDQPLGEGLKAYTLSESNGEQLIFTEVVASSEQVVLEATKPYLITAESKVESMSANNVTMYVNREGSSQDNITGYEFCGTLSTISHEEAVDLKALILQEDQKWHPVVGSANTVKIPAGRAYLKEKTVGNARSIMHTVLVDANATSIKLINSDGTEAYYDLNGRRIEEPKVKGIYVKNGQKVIFNN